MNEGDEPYESRLIILTLGEESTKEIKKTLKHASFSHRAQTRGYKISTRLAFQ